MKIKICLDDDEIRAIWETALRARDEVACWPAWKRGEDVSTEIATKGRMSATVECGRCKELYTIEFGYEKTEHDFCWPCCSEIVDRMLRFQEDNAFDMNELYHKQGGTRSDSMRVVLQEFVRQCFISDL